MNQRQEIERFFRNDPKTNTEYFIGERLEIFISMRFESYKCLKIEKTLTTLAIFDMVIDGKIEDAVFITGIVEMCPSEISVVKIEDESFVKAVFYYGDIFIKNTVVQQIASLGFVIFYEVINQGNRSKHLDYFKLVKIFDVLQEVAGINFNVERKTFELICAHIHRSKDNLAIFYRQTDMKDPPVIVQFKDIAHNTITTSGKIIGNYFSDSLRSAIVNPSEDNSEIENIMRA